MEDYYRSEKKNNRKDNVKRCKECGVRIGAVATHCMIHYRSKFRKMLTALSVVVLRPSIIAAGVNLTNTGNVTLQWDRSTSDLLTNSVTYRVYARTNTIGTNSIAVTNIFTGTNLSVSLTNMNAGRWRFYAVASQGGVESLPSNEIVYIVPTNAPTAPNQFAVVYLETTVDYTNWTSFEAFRARIYRPSE